MAVEPTYLLKHPAPPTPKNIGGVKSNDTVADFTELMPARVGRIRLAIQNQGTAVLQIRLGDSQFDLRGATSLNSGDGGSLDDLDWKGAVDYFGEAVTFSYAEYVAP